MDGPPVFIAIHLVLARRRMVIHFDMDLNPTVPIKKLKEELAKQLSMQPVHQQWFYRNKLLSEEHSLERVGVIHDSIIEVRPMPGLETAGSSADSPAQVSAAAYSSEMTREV